MPLVSARRASHDLSGLRGESRRAEVMCLMTDVIAGHVIQSGWWRHGEFLHAACAMSSMRASRPWEAEHTGARLWACHYRVVLRIILTQRVQA